MTDSPRLKTELGRIRGAIESGSFDRDTALDALDKAEKALDAPAVVEAKSPEPVKASAPMFGTKSIVTPPAPAPHPAPASTF